MKQLFIALRVFIALTVITGFLYTFAITAIAQFIFPHAAGGSLIVADGHVRGSRLIAQEFSSPRYFWARPSAVSYNPLPSGGSNLSVIGNDMKKAMDDRSKAFRAAHGLTSDVTVPSDMLFTSGSGLDPDISPEAARLQIEHIAKERRFSKEAKASLILLVRQATQRPQMGFLGEPRINVLSLNRALDLIKDQ